VPPAGKHTSQQTPPAHQRLQALRKANEIRASRAQLKKDLATGRVLIHDVLTTPPEFVQAERISVLLLAVPGYGPVCVSKLLAKARISESRRLAALTERQRGELLHHFQP
jgi:S13-like H2TH domain